MKVTGLPEIRELALAKRVNFDLDAGRLIFASWERRSTGSGTMLVG